MNSGKKRSRFGVGLLIYVVIFIIIAIAALVFLNRFLAAYESTRVYNIVSSYSAKLNAEGSRDACLDALKDVDRSIQCDEELAAYTADILSSAKLVKSPSKSTAELTAYSIRTSDNIPVGTVWFEQSGDKELNFNSWVVAKEEYDFSGLYSTSSVTVPPEYTVKVNGTALDSSYITEKGIRYRLLEEYYPKYSSLPVMVTYSTGSNLGDVRVDVYDRKGSPVSESDMNENAFLHSCSAEEISIIESFAYSFIDRYVTFTANVNGNMYYNYEQLKNVIVWESDLHDRMRAAFGSFGYTFVKECNVVSESVNFCLKLDSDTYLADCSYTTETRANADPVRESRNIRLIIKDDPERGYIAEKLTNY